MTEHWRKNPRPARTAGQGPAYERPHSIVPTLTPSPTKDAGVDRCLPSLLSGVQLHSLAAGTDPHPGGSSGTRTDLRCASPHDTYQEWRMLSSDCQPGDKLGENKRPSARRYLHGRASGKSEMVSLNLPRPQGHGNVTQRDGARVRRRHVSYPKRFHGFVRSVLVPSSKRLPGCVCGGGKLGQELWAPSRSAIVSCAYGG